MVHKTWIPYLYHYETSLLKKYGEPSNPIIAISGLSGSGKGTHSKLLQENLRNRHKLNLRIYEGGEFFRAVAKQYGYSEAKLQEFNERLAGDKKLTETVDYAIDVKTLETMIQHGGIFVGRLASAVAGDWGYKVLLTTDPKIIAGRIAKDPKRAERGQTVEEILEGLMERDQGDITRYEKLYGINYEKLAKKCNLKLEAGDKEATAKKIFDEVSRYLKRNKFVK